MNIILISKIFPKNIFISGNAISFENNLVFYYHSSTIKIFHGIDLFKDDTLRMILTHRIIYYEKYSLEKLKFILEKVLTFVDK